MFKIYNTRTKTLDELPTNTTVKIYSCGMTVYDECHLGHLRSMIVMDAFLKYFRQLQIQYKWVRNITDIDDKIINKSKETGQYYTSITSQVIQSIKDIEKRFNLLTPDIEPRVTDYLPEIIAMIADLEKKGYTYQSTDGLLFNIKKYPQYGILKHIPEENREDFYLWKTPQDGPVWDSPWGKGRPGWHIECSAMSCTLLGKSFDLHTGGRDLLFPHHENEIAQSYCCNDRIPSKIWMHLGMITYERRKMSKSLDNFFYVKDLLNKYEEDVIKWYILKSHYRKDLDFTFKKLDNAQNELYKINDRISNTTEQDINSALQHRCIYHMMNDLDTPALTGCISRYSKQHGKTIGTIMNSLGFKHHNNSIDPKDLVLIEQQIEQRNKYRKNKQFSQADLIRQELSAIGIELTDMQDKTIWKKKK